MKKCLHCNNPIENHRKFCSLKCCGQYEEQQSIQDWLAGKISGHKGKVKNINPFVRHYLFKKYDNACCKCKWNVPHPISGVPPLEANHIDGNANNTIESNLELLCPNCHSLTIHFKNRNKGKGNRPRYGATGRS
jgi:hypothetical protein